MNKCLWIFTHIFSRLLLSFLIGFESSKYPGFHSIVLWWIYWGKDAGATEEGGWSFLTFVDTIWTNVKDWLIGLFTWVFQNLAFGEEGWPTGVVWELSGNCLGFVWASKLILSIFQNLAFGEEGWPTGVVWDLSGNRGQRR